MQLLSPFLSLFFPPRWVLWFIILPYVCFHPNNIITDSATLSAAMTIEELATSPNRRAAELLLLLLLVVVALTFVATNSAPQCSSMSVAAPSYTHETGCEAFVAAVANSCIVRCRHDEQAGLELAGSATLRGR